MSSLYKNCMAGDGFLIHGVARLEAREYSDLTAMTTTVRVHYVYKYTIVTLYSVEVVRATSHNSTLRHEN
jgi:hypothetical protein